MDWKTLGSSAAWKTLGSSAAWKALGSAAMGLAITLVGGDAWAGGYCSDKVPCKLATDTCHGGYCVPAAKLCTGTPSCSSWQKCDFTCPWGGVSSTEPAPVPVPGPGEADAGSSGGGSGGSGSADASSGAKAPMPAQDAGGAQEDPAPPPEEDAGSTDGGTTTVPDNCPKDLGVCVADPVKVPAQPGCEAFCTAAMACNFGESSSGGSGGSGGGSTPPSPGVDAGSGEDPDEKKGFAPKPEDAGSSEDQASDASMAPPPEDAGGVPEPLDGGSTDGGGGQADELAQCVLMCSIWKLEKVAPVELMNLEQCVVVYKDQCDTMKTKCEPMIEPFMTKALADDSWALGLGGFMGSDSGNPPKEGGDVTPVDTDAGTLPGSTDASTASDAAVPQNGDDATGGTGGTDSTGGTPGADATTGADGLQAGDTASSGGTGSTAATADSGCTAGTGPGGNPAGLAGLGVLLAAALWRRRRVA